jgi:hypothetical protein
MPGVVQLGGEPDLLAGHAGILDTGTDFGLVAVSQRGVNVAVASQERIADSDTDLIRLGLPCSKTDGGDLVAGVKGVGLPIERRAVNKTVYGY